MRNRAQASRQLIRKLALPEPPRAHAPPRHVLLESQHYSTLGYFSGKLLSFLFFTFLRQFSLMYLQLKSALRNRNILVATCKKIFVSFHLDDTCIRNELNKKRPPSECTKRSILGKDISVKNYIYIYTCCSHMSMIEYAVCMNLVEL